MAATLVIIGCGNLGTAILSSLLQSITRQSESNPDNQTIKISRIIACVRQKRSVERIKNVLGPTLSQHVEIVQSPNNLATVVAKGNYAILSCDPESVQPILTSPGMDSALDGKLLMSTCAGVTAFHIRQYLLRSKCSIVRVMPNVASSIKQSMTVISPDIELSSENLSMVNWIFSQIGLVDHLPISQMDIATTLCGSGPAFFSLFLDSIVDGALAMGMSRDVANRLAAQSMKGAAELILNGEHPAILKDRVCSPGGCTIAGIAILENGAVRGHIAKAVRHAVAMISKLGNGNENLE